MSIKLHHELKELLPHLAEMSSNEVKLYLLLQLKANWQEGPRSGCIEAPFDDLARECAWSLSTLKRTIRELKAKSHIDVERVKSDTTAAANVRAGVKSDPVKVCQLGAGVKSDTTKVQAVPSRVKSDPQGSVPAVPSEPGVVKSKVSEIPPKYLAGELSAIARQALSYAGFQCDLGSLSKGFVVVLERRAKRKHQALPGIFMTMVLDACLMHQRKRAAEGKDPALFRLPPGWQKHRDRLRRAEREAGRRERVA